MEKNNSPYSVIPYTGQINVTIPLVQISSKNIGLNFALTYSNSGVKYQDYSGKLGLGWNLSGFGNITRIVRSYPDDFTRGYLGIDFYGKIIERAILNNEYLHDTYWGYKQENDSEPDLYIINTPTFNLEFTFDGDGNIIKKAEDGIIIKSLNYINNTNSNNTSSFVAIDPLGTEYYFSSTLSNRDLTTEKFGADNITYTSCWHLDKIINAPKSETIYLEYTKYGTADEIYNYYSWYRPESVPSATLEVLSQSFNKKYLTKVSTKYGYLKFNYIRDRRDIEGGAPRLESIIEYKDKLKNYFVSKFKFEYSYFGTTTSTQGKVSDKCRLKLDRILKMHSENGNEGEIFKSFQYKNPNLTYDRKIDRSDYLGYYTTFPSGDPLVTPTLRQPFSLENTSYAQLFKITDKSGAYNEFIYEHNTFEKLSVDSNYILGGLRVKELRSYEAPNTVPSTQKFNYVFNGKSSGIVHNILYDNLSYTWVVRNSPAIKTFFSNAIYNINSSLWTYTKVEKKIENNSSIIYEYAHHCDSIMDVLIRDNFIFSKAMYGLKNSKSVSSNSDSHSEYFRGSTIDQGYKRSSLKRLTFNDSNNKIVKKIEYDYVTLNGQKGGYGLTSLVVKMNPGLITSTGNAVYYFFNESWRLSKERTVDYTKDGDSLIYEKRYTYHANKYLLKTTQVDDSKRMTFKSTSFYPQDFQTMPMASTDEKLNLQQMINLNMKNVVIHENTELPNGQMIEIHNTFTSPFQVSQIAKYLKSSVNPNGENLQSSNMYYDGENRLLTQVKSDGEIKSVAYDLNDRIILEAINATAKPITKSPNTMVNEFYYNGFEDLTFTESYTGVGSLSTPYTVPFSMPNSKKYLIDYRFFDTASQTWKYIKKRYTNNMLITQGSRIDELRVYPEDSQITTYTYDIYGLKKSETNTNGNTIFYEYDDKYRLIFLMDQNKNIIKSYCYNDAGENIDCYGTLGKFKNTEISKSFIKNNCPSGNTSLPVLYIIPVGKHKSTISQADADALALADLNSNGQQYANDNGICETPSNCIRYRITVPKLNIQEKTLHVTYFDCNNTFQTVPLNSLERDFNEIDEESISFYMCININYTSLEFTEGAEQFSYYIPYTMEQISYCN